MIIRRKTRNLKYLFPLKDEDLHLACKIYKGSCTCESIYVGKTKLNVEVGYLKHYCLSRKLSKHLNENINHVLIWSVISFAQKGDITQKNLEAFYTALMKTIVNKQCNSNVLTSSMYYVIQLFNNHQKCVRFLFLNFFMLDFIQSSVLSGDLTKRNQEVKKGKLI